MKLIRTLALAAGLTAAGLQPGTAEEVKLIFATVNPAGSLMNREAFLPWAARVNEAGKGVVQIDVREGPTLANYGNVYNRVLDDVIQIGWGLPDIIAGKFPLSQVAGLPFLTDSSAVGSVAMYDLYKSGLLDSEYKDIVPLTLVMLSQSVVHLQKKPASLVDLTGIKIVAGSHIDAEKIERLGGTPISLPLGDMYEGLQRGTVDAALIGWSAYSSFKLGEVTNFHIEEPLGAAAAFVFMSRKKFDSLSPEAQKILLDNSGLDESRRIGQILDQDRQNTRDAAKAEANRTVVTLSADDSKVWHEKLDPLTEEWAKSTPNGQAVLDRLRSAIAAESKP